MLVSGRVMTLVGIELGIPTSMRYFSGPTIVVLWFFPPSLRLFSVFFQWRWSFQPLQYVLFKTKSWKKTISFMEIPHTHPKKKIYLGFINPHEWPLRAAQRHCQRINKKSTQKDQKNVAEFEGSNLPVSKRLQEDVASPKKMSRRTKMPNKNSSKTQLSQIFKQKIFGIAIDFVYQPSMSPFFGGSMKTSVLFTSQLQPKTPLSKAKVVVRDNRNTCLRRWCFF